ncbi:hypothetical protein FM110_05050 [Brachybacterium nesterenkovii]|uniref:Uncharacterized protein n=1 Tax=Brachybacterium nesterenkovii TaxID=47847 RepID=A0A1X6WZE8_9MICO|nr:hypothetical protein FM110_05050 [Brachybacterium nesterenkovii]
MEGLGRSRVRRGPRFAPLVLGIRTHDGGHRTLPVPAVGLSPQGAEVAEATAGAIRSGNCRR